MKRVYTARCFNEQIAPMVVYFYILTVQYLNLLGPITDAVRLPFCPLRTSEIVTASISLTIFLKHLFLVRNYLPIFIFRFKPNCLTC